jgi:hypothetical protein
MITNAWKVASDAVANEGSGKESIENRCDAREREAQRAGWCVRRALARIPDAAYPDAFGVAAATPLQRARTRTCRTWRKRRDDASAELLVAARHHQDVRALLLAPDFRDVAVVCIHRSPPQGVVHRRLFAAPRGADERRACDCARA